MLILKRRQGERVVIGEDVILEVVAIKGGNVILGFLAPEEIEIDRSEVRESKEAAWREGGGA